MTGTARADAAERVAVGSVGEGRLRERAEVAHAEEQGSGVGAPQAAQPVAAQGCQRGAARRGVISARAVGRDVVAVPAPARAPARPIATWV